MTETTQFRPDWVSPPGDTIEDLLQEQALTKSELATRTGRTQKHISQLIGGRAAISPETAEQLAAVLGSSPEFWLRREAQYKAALRHRRTLDELKAKADWLKTLPVKWMSDQGWIRKCSHKGEQVLELLRFFGVASIDAYEATYGRPLAAYRSSAHEKRVGALSAWLRQAEQTALAIDTAPYDKARFQTALFEARSLTTESDPAVFLPRLQALVAPAGVAVVVVRASKGTSVHGATQWLSPQKAMLALSARHLSDDQLWFSFFHEACHVLRHSKKMRVIEGLDGLDEKLEAEADAFAQDFLIPPNEVRQLQGVRAKAVVKRLAEGWGISPGIVVGRMQREGWLEHSHMNDLKQRYRWS